MVICYAWVVPAVAWPRREDARIFLCVVGVRRRLAPAGAIRAVWWSSDGGPISASLVGASYVLRVHCVAATSAFWAPQRAAFPVPMLTNAVQISTSSLR